MRAKKKAKKKFNWLVKLNALVRRKRPLTDEEYYNLRFRAAQWPTCACGQLCAALPRDCDAEPKDGELSQLGLRFYDKVAAKRWRGARATFRKIETRSAKLLAAMVGVMLLASSACGDVEKSGCRTPTQVICSVGPGLTIPEGWKLVAAADFNHDNYPDFVLFNEATGETYIWFLHPDYTP